MQQYEEAGKQHCCHADWTCDVSAAGIPLETANTLAKHCTVKQQLFQTGHPTHTATFTSTLITKVSITETECLLTTATRFDLTETIHFILSRIQCCNMALSTLAWLVATAFKASSNVLLTETSTARALASTS